MVWEERGRIGIQVYMYCTVVLDELYVYTLESLAHLL